jgi:5,10-methylenetetrahydromethanopterin reductase
MRGPKSFELAGEIADGVHIVSALRKPFEFAVNHVRIGAERAGREWRTLDLGAALVGAISTNAAAAKHAARVAITFYISAMPDELLARHGIDRASLQPIHDALGRGNIKEAIELTTPELADRLSLAGSPEEWVERITQDFAPIGINHLICGLIDSYLVAQWSAMTLENVPDLRGQLRLIHDHVMPAFSED